MPRTSKYHISAGDRFSRLVAKQFSHRDGYRIFWDFRCDCGTEKKIEIYNVLRGSTKGCGCVRATFSVRTKTVHGEATRDNRSPEYVTWSRMRERCGKPECADYANYGARGISVCERWKSFQNFLSDMGRRPSDGHSIGRKDVNGNYEPGNCFWSTATEQARARRNTRMIEVDGIWKPLWQESERSGISARALSYRHRGSIKNLEDVINEKLPTE